MSLRHRFKIGLITLKRCFGYLVAPQIDLDVLFGSFGQCLRPPPRLICGSI
jgi:hypothetical protein